jgi:HK97 family phage prohead protease
MPTRGFPFEIKELTSTGAFSGIASPYGVTDLLNEVVDAGAFVRTLSDGGRQRPLLWQHTQPVGLCQLTDDPTGLMLTGKLSMGIQLAQDAYHLLKDGVVKGLSIGFQTVREEFVDGVRHLKEIKLWEISLVTFPCNESAQVTSVKAARTDQIRAALAELRFEALRAFKEVK